MLTHKVRDIIFFCNLSTTREEVDVIGDSLLVHRPGGLWGGCSHGTGSKDKQHHCAVTPKHVHLAKPSVSCGTL